MVNINSTSFVKPRTTYCNVADIRDFLQISTRTTSTNPSTMDIEKLIIRAEAEIDRKTRTSWKPNIVVNEFYDLQDAYINRFRESRFRVYDDRGKIALKRRHLQKLIKLEIWDGARYIDYIDNYREGRGLDYYVDYREGVIYFWSRYPYRVRNACRISYIWGESEVPEDIKEACIKIVARQLVTSDDYSILFPEGTSNIPLQQKSDIWKEDIKEILESRKIIIYY